jgi:cytochrome b involved in lipid metabolism
MVRRSKEAGAIEKDGKLLLIAHGHVYDATNFIRDHPAGVLPLLKKAGEDATVDYDFHSVQAQRDFWGPLCVGYVTPCDRDPKSPDSCAVS